MTASFANSVTSTKTEKIAPSPKPQRFIFVVQLHDGRIVIGTAENAARRIAAINSGHNPAITKTLQINNIVGIKPITESRTLPGTVKYFCDKYGKERVICV